MRTSVLLFCAMLVTGCINIPDPYPIQMHTYELNKDTKVWTHRDCSTKPLMAKQMQSVCTFETIQSPPAGVIPSKGE
jgi:hypothetical protein